MCLLVIIISANGFINAQNEWDENWFDLRVIDIPQIGIFYDLENNDNVVFRMAFPMMVPVLGFTHVAYASSNFGINLLGFDVTFGSVVSEKSLSRMKELIVKGEREKAELKGKSSDIDINDISTKDAKRKLLGTSPFSFVHLVRILPLSLWGGFPLSSQGAGLYLLFEYSPVSWLKSESDDYEKMHFGIGFSAGLKLMLSRHLELEFKYENYFAYTNSALHAGYIGLTFKYRLFEPGYYGVW